MRKTVKCRWIHIIDSTGQSSPDEGSFTTLPNGDDLEIGSMPCPGRGGAVTDYEEIWRTLPPRSGVPWGWIMQSSDGKTFISKIGGGFIAMRQGIKAFGVRCEEWDEEVKEWRSKYAVGNVDGLVSMNGTGLELGGEEDLKEGGLLDILGEKFVVRASELMGEGHQRRWKDAQNL
jgi:hypothetical protein